MLFLMIRHYRSFTTRDYNAVKIISLYRISGRGIFPQNAFFFLQNLQYNLRCFCFVCFSLSENYLNSWNCNRVASTERALWWHHVTRPKPVENLHWFWKTCKLLRILWRLLDLAFNFAKSCRDRSKKIFKKTKAFYLQLSHTETLLEVLQGD